MLIFDSFPTLDKAKEFSEYIGKEFELEGIVCTSQEQSNKHDSFPWKLTPPIVLIERKDFETEKRVEESVEKFGGQFAGT